MRDYYAFTGPFVERLVAGLLTTPQALGEMVRGYEEAGCGHLSLVPTVANMDQLQRAAEVVASLR